MRRIVFSVLTAGTLLAPILPGTGRRARQRRGGLGFAATSRSTLWERVATIPLPLPTYHPQGFALVGTGS